MTTTARIPAPWDAPAAEAGRPAASYHAAEDKKKRAVPVTYTRNEDKELTATKRRQLKNAVLDLVRNFPVLSWSVNKYVDFNCRFSFQSRTGDDGLDRDIEDLVKRHSAARMFDATGRMNLRTFLRTLNFCRLFDGDAFGVKVGQALQGIEGDRIALPWRNLPAGLLREDFSHGVRYGAGGRPLEYCLCRRNGNSLEFERLLPARHVLPLIEYMRFDQGRGITPLSAAINMAQDLYEGLDAYAIKVKAVAWAGMQIIRGENKLSAFNPQSATTTDADGNEYTEYDIPTNGRPFIMHMDRPGDEIKFIESNTPPEEFIAFVNVIVRLTLLSLGIPYTFYDQTRGSYTIQKDAWTQWEIASKPKREMNREWLNRWTAWQIGLAIARGEILLPRGTDFSSLVWEWQWEGRPYMDLKELQTDIEAVRFGLRAAPDVIKEHGGDPVDVLDKNQEFYHAMRDRNLPTAAWDEAKPYPTDKDEDETDAE